MAEKPTSGYTNVSSVIFEVIADLNEAGTHNFDRYLNFALRGLQEWHFDSAQEIKTVKLQMNSYNAVDFPDDYVDWCKLGIQVGDRVKTFGANDESISLNHDDTDDCGNPALNAVASCNELPGNCESMGGYYFHNYINSHGEHLGKLFGVGGGKNCLGSWKINRERRQFQFNSEVARTNVYLEYISNGFNPCGESVINQYARNMLRTYIHWQRAIFKFGAASGEAQEWKIQFEANQRLARARVFDISIQEIIDISRKHYSPSVKN